MFQTTNQLKSKTLSIWWESSSRSVSSQFMWQTTCPKGAPVDSLDEHGWPGFKTLGATWVIHSMEKKKPPTSAKCPQHQHRLMDILTCEKSAIPVLARLPSPGWKGRLGISKGFWCWSSDLEKTTVCAIDNSMHIKMTVKLLCLMYQKVSQSQTCGCTAADRTRNKMICPVCHRTKHTHTHIYI